jgi:hypothetical protein
MKDYSVEIDPQQSKVIAEIICKEIEQSLDANKEIYSRAARNERAYQQITKSMSEGKVPTFPWYGAADYFIPLIEWTIDAVWGRVLKVMFGKRPYMQAKGVENEDIPKEAAITQFVDQIHTEKIKLYDQFRFFVKQVLKLPFAVMKYCWVYSGDSIYEKERAITMISPDGSQQQQVLAEEKDKLMQMANSGFVPSGEQEVTVRKDREIYNAPKLQYIKFSDYVWAGSAKRGYKPYWEGDRFWQTVSEIKSNPMYIPESVERISKTLGTKDMTLSQAALVQRSKLFETFHWYGKLPVNTNNMIDFTDLEAIEHEVHAIVSFKEKELLYIKKWEYERIPELDRVYIRGEFEETEEFCGRSLVDKLYSTQRELNTLHNTIMNNAQLAMTKIFTKRRTLVGEEYEKPQIYPGVFLEVDQASDIQVLDVGDVKAISWELEQSFINFAERISNISVYQTGTARSGGSKTKGEVDRTVYEGNIGMDKFIEQCANILKKISQWTLDYYANNMPEGLEKRILGQESKQEISQQGQLGQTNPYWQTDDITGQFDFIWENTSLNSSEAYRIQISNDLMDRFMGQPMIAQSMIATWEILRMGLEARKITDWQKILPPREAVVAEMKRMQAEAQAKEQVASGEAGIKQSAIQQAMQRGVPPTEAMRIMEGMNQGGSNV